MNFEIWKFPLQLQQGLKNCTQEIYLLLIFVGNRNLTSFVWTFENCGSMTSSLTLLVIQKLVVIKWLYHTYISHTSTVLLCSFRLKTLDNNTKNAAKAIFQSNSVSDKYLQVVLQVKKISLSAPELKKFTINLHHWLLSHQIAVGLNKSGCLACISDKTLK